MMVGLGGVDPGPRDTEHEWLGFYERCWNERLDTLERLLREEDARTARKPDGEDK